MPPAPPRRRGAGPLVLAVTVLALFAADRALYRVLGEPVWQYDPVLLYTHRPNAVAHWHSFPGAYPLRANRWGFADDDFPREKPPGEWRAVVLGDSVAMGFGLDHADALPDQLERRLAGRGQRPVQVINAAVSGYGTAQYPEALRRALAFAPDLVLIGVCLNDVLGARLGDPRRSPSWFAQRGVAETANPLLAWTVTETGLGRLALRTRAWLVDHTDPVARGRRRQRENAWMVAHSRDSPIIAAAWTRALDELDQAVAVARAAGVPLAVIVFPFDLQLGHPELQDPQRRLAAWAAQRGVPLFDATPALAQRVAAGEPPPALYLDELHFRPAGHAVVAEALAAWLDRQALRPPAR